MNRYHREVGFPDSLIIPDFLINLKYTNHALTRVQREGYYKKLGILPSIVRVCPTNVHEVYSENDISCRKVLIRISYDPKRDMILILDLIKETYAKVVTLWLNKKKILIKLLTKQNI